MPSQTSFIARIQKIIFGLFLVLCLAVMAVQVRGTVLQGDSIGKKVPADCTSPSWPDVNEWINFCIQRGFPPKSGSCLDYCNCPGATAPACKQNPAGAAADSQAISSAPPDPCQPYVGKCEYYSCKGDWREYNNCKNEERCAYVPPSEKFCCENPQDKSCKPKASSSSEDQCAFQKPADMSQGCYNCIHEGCKSDPLGFNGAYAFCMATRTDCQGGTNSSKPTSSAAPPSSAASSARSSASSKPFNICEVIPSLCGVTGGTGGFGGPGGFGGTGGTGVLGGTTGGTMGGGGTTGVSGGYSGGINGMTGGMGGMGTGGAAGGTSGGATGGVSGGTTGGTSGGATGATGGRTGGETGGTSGGGTTGGAGGSSSSGGSSASSMSSSAASSSSRNSSRSSFGMRGAFPGGPGTPGTPGGASPSVRQPSGSQQNPSGDPFLQSPFLGVPEGPPASPDEDFPGMPDDQPSSSFFDLLPSEGFDADSPDSTPSFLNAIGSSPAAVPPAPVAKGKQNADSGDMVNRALQVVAKTMSSDPSPEVLGAASQAVAKLAAALKDPTSPAAIEQVRTALTLVKEAVEREHPAAPEAPARDPAAAYALVPRIKAMGDTINLVIDALNGRGAGISEELGSRVTVAREQVASLCTSASAEHCVDAVEAALSVYQEVRVLAQPSLLDHEDIGNAAERYYWDRVSQEEAAFVAE